MASQAAALGTLFELPLDSFGAPSSVGDAGAELTAAALQALELEATPAEAAEADAPAGTSAGEASRTCIACGVGVGGISGFASAEEQRAHYRTDWHRYNVKRRAAGQKAAVSEADFSALVEGEQQEVGSISGSESEASSDEEGEGGGAAAARAVAGPQFAFAAAGATRVQLL